MAGCSISIAGPQIKIDHLIRLGLYHHLGLDTPPMPDARPAAGRYIPLQMISGGPEVLSVTNAICDLMLRRYDGARAFVPAVEWMTYEIADNIVLHAQAQSPGIVCAQYYEAGGRLEISVVDLGRGLKASLSETRTVADDTAALKLAVTRGVTRSSHVGQGNGLAGTLEIARANGGTLELCSGAVMLQQIADKQAFATVPRMPGTGIVLELDTRRPVELRQTEIAGGGGWRDWNYLIAEGERLAERGGLRVLDECPHVAGRPPAQALRRKIEALLPDLEQPMVLDFDGITMASSSFLDELLGRLVEAHGPEVLGTRIQLKNVQPLIQRLAENVIGQRLAASRER
ncbi:STAS-like domain-containing protein [Mesorhizobium sp. CO1-1-11]|uniref:STAS-like domain-containing protein n=1 Tax=Mesorhizobium sp. CO1-1-11 TaxID=2876636 RepID=UPI001CCB68CF|nr:STAS-like domain-containing protein [Mesorhizobium sp. CO1-1-11]MBZ9727944.1 STAS-like domain-containing protein [Mesorhizobium sp. CO1-1-11]